MQQSRVLVTEACRALGCPTFKVRELAQKTESVKRVLGAAKGLVLIHSKVAKADTWADPSADESTAGKWLVY